MALKQRHNKPDETAATTQRRVETATATKTTGKINKTTGFEIQTNGTRTPLSQRKLPPPPLVLLQFSPRGVQRYILFSQIRPNNGDIHFYELRNTPSTH